VKTDSEIFWLRLRRCPQQRLLGNRSHVLMCMVLPMYNGRCRNLLGQLEELHATVMTTDTANQDGELYVLAQVPSGSSSDSYDTVQIKLRPDGVALFKSEAARSTPDPPFCLTPGCISGPGNRQRMERLRDALGWTVLETDEDKQWVQILLH
jgi:hypothetical protein